MGFFSKLTQHTKALNKIANAVANVKVMLDSIENTYNPGIGNYLVAAWVCRAGILDIMESAEILGEYSIHVPINGHFTKMSVDEACMMSIGRLSIKAGTLDSASKDAIMDVLEKGQMFYKIDKQIPSDKKALFQYP